MDCPEGTRYFKTPFGEGCVDAEGNVTRPGSTEFTAFPKGFIEIFGPRPEGEATPEHKTEEQLWEQNLEAFDGLMDVEIPPELVAAYENSLLGAPVGYKDKRWGPRVGFPGALFVGFHGLNPGTVIKAPGLIAAQHQVKAVQAGFHVPIPLSPLVPGAIRARNEINGRSA